MSDELPDIGPMGATPHAGLMPQLHDRLHWLSESP